MLISEDMKKFLIKIAIFGILLFGIDRLAGYAFAYMSENAKGGFVGHYHQLIGKTNEDILIFGSSRAIHHYNPTIIEDSLRMSCFNCGQEGSGIIQNYGFWMLIREHYEPKIIIYDVMDEFDLLIGEDNHKYLGWLKESYNRDGIPEIFESVDETEIIKMFCQMYRYNSKWHQIMGDYIYPVYKVKSKGFLPLEGSLDTMKINRNYDLNAKFKFDTLKIEYLHKMVNKHGNSKLVFVVSPSWYGISDTHFEPLAEMCRKNRIPLLNYANDQRFLHKNQFFKDGAHLNAKGADEFTKILVKDLNF